MSSKFYTQKPTLRMLAASVVSFFLFIFVSAFSVAYAENDDGELITFYGPNPVAGSFAEEVDYGNEPRKSSQILAYCKKPGGSQRPSAYEIECPRGSVAEITDFEARTEATFTVNENKFRLSSLIPNRRYHVTITSPDGEVVWEHDVMQTGALRQIYMGNTGNVRDLGGWPADGGTLNYGLLYRGAAIQYMGPDTERWVALNVQREIDLRSDGERYSTDNNLQIQHETSPIPGASYGHYGITGYYGVYRNGTRPVIVSAVSDLMCAVVNGNPCYFHCAAGADRTGTIAFILEAVCGVSRSDIDKDFELTSFYSQRTRTYDMYADMANYFDEYGCESLRDNVIQWLIDSGMSLDLINDFRKAMINGTPEHLRPEDCGLEPVLNENAIQSLRETIENAF